jgi:hypothetical protein
MTGQQPSSYYQDKSRKGSIPACLLLLCAMTLPAAAQNTCVTNPQGTTLCSTSSGVINGNTNDSGSSVYRDDRGNQLDFQTDPNGSATVTTNAGENINWSQPVLGNMKSPALDTAPPPPSGPAPIPLNRNSPF